jgi:hypothetical protein
MKALSINLKHIHATMNCAVVYAKLSDKENLANISEKHVK